MNVLFDIKTIKKIYNVNDIEQLVTNFAQTKYAFYRKSEKLELDNKNVFTWSSLAQFEANEKPSKTPVDGFSFRSYLL